MDSHFYVHNIDPIAISLWEFKISWYWLFYPLSFLAVFFICEYFRTHDKTNPSKQKPLAKNQLIDLFIVSWIGLLVGARLIYVLFYNFSYYLENPILIPQFWLGGMSFHGALLGGFVASIAYSKYRKVNPWKFYDLVVLGLPVALFLGRLGNFINGELWGRQSNAPWAVIFPRADSSPRHPSQLYEAFLEGPILFALLYLLLRRAQLTTGQIAAAFVFGYGALRFVVEFFREPDRQLGFIFSVFSMGQLMCMAMVVIGLWLWRHRKGPST